MPRAATDARERAAARPSLPRGDRRRGSWEQHLDRRSIRSLPLPRVPHDARRRRLVDRCGRAGHPPEGDGNRHRSAEDRGTRQDPVVERGDEHRGGAGEAGPCSASRSPTARRCWGSPEPVPGRAASCSTAWTTSSRPRWWRSSSAAPRATSATSTLSAGRGSSIRRAAGGCGRPGREPRVSRSMRPGRVSPSGLISPASSRPGPSRASPMPATRGGRAGALVVQAGAARWRLTVRSTRIRTRRPTSGTLGDRIDYLHRLCAAWDFGILPDTATITGVRGPGWRDAVDQSRFLTSPSYHLLREWHRLGRLEFLGTVPARISSDPSLEHV